MTKHNTESGQRTVPLAEIKVDEGFNPRSDIERKSLERLTDSIREHGVLVPLLVTPDDGDLYRLVAGHRRYRAAGDAGLQEVPVVVRDVGEETSGLDLALIENMAREQLDPVEEAQAFRRLLDAGLTKRGIAERLAVSQRLVSERLQILELDEGLHPKLADGTIPPGAVKPLARLARIHRGLSPAALAKVEAEPEHGWDEPVTWADLARDPIAVVSSDYEGEEDRLPKDVYESGSSYPAKRFTLDEGAQKRLADLCELISSDPERFQVRFGEQEIEQARALGALHSSSEGWVHLIVGQEVADQLAADYIARCLKLQRKQARAERRADASAGPGEPGSEDGEPDAPEAEEERRKEREEAKERKRSATAYNQELGAAVVKQLSRIKVDERVVKVIAAVNLHGDLARIATRGARYGFPGWPQEVQLKSGRTKTDYLGSSDAAEKAREYLSVAKSAADVAGRLFALVAMARYADEDAVAQSQRAFWDVGPYGEALPWARELVDLIDDVCAERLPERLVKPRIAERRKRREQDERRRREEAERERLIDEAIERLGAVEPKERAAIVAEAEERLGEHRFRAWRLRNRLAELEAQGGQEGDEPEARAAA